MEKENKLTATFKSQDTEEWLDIHFTRPLGLMWANFFNRFDIHPNVVTVLGIVLGAVAGVMFYFPDLWHTLVGIFLLTWANLYDSADGQLARMTGKKTLWGRILDGFASDVWFFAISFAICLRLTPKWGIWIWITAAISGFIFHVKQCQLADYYRNIHLYFIKGREGSELDTYSKVKEEFRNTPWRGNWAWKVFLYSYANYTHSQEQLTPQFQALKSKLQQAFGDNLPELLRADFRKGSLPLMKYTNILTFNTRAIVLYLSLLAGYPWFYFAFEIIIMTAICLYMRYRHERLCKHIIEHLDDYR